jgi:transcriptional regulator of heat shock response
MSAIVAAMDERQSKLLAAIIDQFIETALPVGSKKLLGSGDFLISSATIRAEMGRLEDQGYLEQPHISAGRIPTAKGYRVYVKEFMEPSRGEQKVRQKFADLKEQYLAHKDQERVYEAVALLSNMIPNVAFATVPHKDRVYYLGLANALKQPEFQSDPLLATGIVEVLEREFSDLLDRLEIGPDVHYYIGEEHILPQILSCSLMLLEYRVRDFQGVLGIMGPMRMDYAYNTVALELVSDLLRSS